MIFEKSGSNATLSFPPKHAVCTQIQWNTDDTDNMDKIQGAIFCGAEISV
jgi:hypothetical protein